MPLVPKHPKNDDRHQHQDESSRSHSLLSSSLDDSATTITMLTTTTTSFSKMKREGVLASIPTTDVVEEYVDPRPLLSFTDSEEDEEAQEISFRAQFFSPRGASIRIMILICFLAFGYSATVGVVPAVMTDRYARLYHGYNQQADCSVYHASNQGDMPRACLDGSSDAQNGAAWQSLIQYSFTFATGSLMGSISDHRGRRGVMCIGAFLNTLAPLCLVLIQIMPTMDPGWYYAAGAASGLVSCFATLLSSLADVMRPEWRAASFGTMFAGVYFGFALGPQMALLLPSHLAVSIFAFVMMFMAFLTAVFLVPETNTNLLPPNDNNNEASPVESAAVVETTCDDGSPHNDETAMEWAIRMVRRPFDELSILNRNNLFRLLAVLAFFSGMVTAGDETLLLYYAEERLSFNDHDVAALFLMTGLLAIVIQSMLIKPFIDCVGERYVLIFSFGVGTIYNTMYGLATTKTVFLMAAAVGTISKMSFPTISAIKANNVDGTEQGRIQGALYSVQALAMGTGPMAMRFVYHLTKDAPYPGPGSMFIFSGGLLLVALGCAHALPADQANSRSSSRRCPESNEDASSSTMLGLEIEEDASTPFLDPLSPVFDDLA